MISETLSAVLKSGRAEFNARHEAARLRGADLDNEALMKFITETVDPLAVAAASVSRDRVADVVLASYDVGLELAGQRLLGREAQDGGIDVKLRQLGVTLIPLVVQAPVQVLPALYNALHHLATAAPARSEWWAAELGRLGVQCADAGQLLKLGQVLAWRAGLAHYRTDALATVVSLPAALASAAVGAPPDADWPAVARRLQEDRWFDPSKGSAASVKSRLVAVAKVGSFRGFGGLFVEPPQVVSDREQLWVRSGNDCWMLIADLFGATFHRATTDEFEVAKQAPFAPEKLSVGDGKIVWLDQTLSLPTGVGVSSWAATSSTLAIANPDTFAITLIARL